MFGGGQVLDCPVQCRKGNTCDFYTSVILVKKCVVVEEDVEGKKQQENKQQVKMQQKDE